MALLPSHPDRVEPLELEFRQRVKTQDNLSGATAALRRLFGRVAADSRLRWSKVLRNGQENPKRVLRKGSDDFSKRSPLPVKDNGAISRSQ